MLKNVIARNHVRGQICIQMPKSEAKKYLEKLNEIELDSQDLGLAPRWKRLQAVLGEAINA